MWILGTPLREFTYFYLPSIFAVMVAVLSPNLGEESVVYGLLAMGIIDSGHVYTTSWRTWFHREEFTRISQYWIYPLFFFLLFSTWFYFGGGFLWAFVVYATLYHHTRQVYGFSKWYQKLNKRSDKVSDGFLYFFAYFPMVIYHFRPEAVGGYYTETDLFLFPNTEVRDSLLAFYFAGIILWIIRELKLWWSGAREVNRILSVAFPASVYAYCFLIGKNHTQVLFPLLFLHGIAYFGVMGQSLTRTQKRFSNGTIAALVVIVTAAFFGIFESWAEENIIPRFPEEFTVLEAFVVGLSLTPLFSHYAFDAIIWRKDHPEASAVFSSHK